MNRSRLVATALAVVSLSACGEEITLPPLTGLDGTWDATLYEFRDEATGTRAVDMIEMGSTMVIVIDEGAIPPTVAATYDDFQGNDWFATGTVDGDAHELTIGGGIFSVVLSGNTMTLTNPEAVYSFSGSVERATVTIQATRR